MLVPILDVDKQLKVWENIFMTTNIETFDKAIATLQSELDATNRLEDNGQPRYSGPVAEYAKLRISAQITLLERGFSAMMSGMDPEVYAGELDLATVIADSPTTEIITN